MKGFLSDNRWMVILLASLAIGIWSADPGAVWAQQESGGSETGTGGRVHIIADRMVTNSKTKTVEFIGNVQATQDDTLITGDRLNVHYESGGDGNDPVNQGAIKQIIVTGNVKIHMDDKIAVAERAVYTTENATLVLTGTNSKITSESNSVSGDKIVLYRNEDRMVVEGSSSERVEAILYPKDKGIK